MSSQPRGRFPLGLIRLYPSAWRRRHGAEFADLITELVASRRRGRLAIALNVVVGAVDAHLLRSHAMPAIPRDPALRRGLYDGLLLSAAIAVVIVLTNVVFPTGPAESDSDPEYLARSVGTYLAIAALLVLIGLRARRRRDSLASGAKAGAVAGFVVGFLATASFLAVDNLFFGTISRQHDKIVGFAASGETSMRTFVNVGLLAGAPGLIAVITLIGTGLGFLGGALPRGRRATTT